MDIDIGLYKAEVSYKVPGGKNWKIKRKLFRMSYVKFESLSNKPSHEIIKHLFNIKKGIVDYFELMEIGRYDNGQSRKKEKGRSGQERRL